MRWISVCIAFVELVFCTRASETKSVTMITYIQESAYKMRMLGLNAALLYSFLSKSSKTSTASIHLKSTLRRDVGRCMGWFGRWGCIWMDRYDSIYVWLLMSYNGKSLYIKKVEKGQNNKNNNKTRLCIFYWCKTYFYEVYVPLWHVFLSMFSPFFFIFWFHIIAPNQHINQNCANPPKNRFCFRMLFSAVFFSRYGALYRSCRIDVTKT